jgi:hypothetical protein
MMSDIDRVMARLDRFERCHPERPMGLGRTIDELATLRGKIALRVGAEAAERIVGDFVDTLTPAEGEGVH